MSKQTLLQQYAGKMKAQGRNFMSDEEAQADALLWQNNRDEVVLDRLFTNYALLAIKKIHGFKERNTDIVSPEDIDAWALEGIQKAIEKYEVGVSKDKLITHVSNGAFWNANNELREYLTNDPSRQAQANKLLRETQSEKGRALTTAEEKDVLNTISPKFHEYYYARKPKNTITSGALKSSMWSEHPSTDDQAGLQRDFNDHMDRFVDGQILSPPQALERERMKEDVDDTLGALTAREATVLRMRFGIGVIDVLSAKDSSHRDWSHMTLDDVGDVFGLYKETVRQIEAKALRKLRHPKRSEHLAAYIPEHKNAVRLAKEDNDILQMEEEAFESFLDDLSQG